MEDMQKWMMRIAAVIIFILCIALIVTGQRTIGIPYLMKMIAGLLGLLVLLYIYNRANQ